MLRALSSGAHAKVPTLQKTNGRYYWYILEWRRGTRTHRFVVVCVGASAMSPDVVYADDHGEHGKENGAKRGSLRKGIDVLRVFFFFGVSNLYYISLELFGYAWLAQE